LEGRRYYRPSRHGAEAAFQKDPDDEQAGEGSGA
jgi:hypothetical protein